MGTCAIVADDNIRLLEQGLDLLERLSDDAYGLRPSAGASGSVGAHLRHCLDHYANFLAGVAEGRIDYDARQRDVRIETERAYALKVLRGTVDGLKGVRGSLASQPLMVKMDCGDDEDSRLWWSASSLQRELQFLLSHTVHHYALIGLILGFHGIDLAPGFGVAPSTLRYLQSARAPVGAG